MKIPPEREADILAKAGEGWPHHQIAAWLLSEHQVEVSRQAISKLLARVQGERSQVAKAIVREHLARTLTPDLDLLDEQTANVRELAKSLFERAKKNSKRVPRYLRVVEQIRRNVHTKLHFSGADQPDNATSYVAVERRLLERVARAVREGEGPPVPGDPSDPDGGGEAGS